MVDVVVMGMEEVVVMGAQGIREILVREIPLHHINHGGGVLIC